MTNEYGAQIDRNGYAPSIMGDLLPDVNFCGCFVCGVGGDLARHEIFPGPYRTNSKRYGLWVNLCPRCHDVWHKTGGEQRNMKKYAQTVAMKHYGWTVRDFRRHFGKNWI